MSIRVRLNLGKLKVQSFMASLEDAEEKKVEGGEPAEAVLAVPDGYSCNHTCQYAG